MTDINKNEMFVPNLNSKLFSYRIKYNQKGGTTNPDTSLFAGKNVKPMYNGNIAEVDWSKPVLMEDNFNIEIDKSSKKNIIIFIAFFCAFFYLLLSI